MFCPKCAHPLEPKGETSWCQPGDMWLSVDMENGLQAAFGEGSSIEPVTPLGFRMGGTWYCPRDATLMNEVDGVIGCPACGRSLNPFAYGLVELHPHRWPDDPPWRFSPIG